MDKHETFPQDWNEWRDLWKEWLSEMTKAGSVHEKVTFWHPKVGWTSTT